MAVICRVISPQDHLIGNRWCLDNRCAHILGNIDEHWARSAGTCNIECLLHNPPEICGILDEVVVLGDRHSDAGDVGFLEGVISQQVCRDLPGQCDYRYRIHIGCGDTGDEVACAGAGCCEAYPYTTTRTCIPVRGMRCCLFVPYKDVLQG